MRRSLPSILGIAALTALPLLADFSYQQTSTITGGLMASMMKVAGVFSKQAREPIRATIAVKGDRMAHRSATSASIIDLGAETMTHIDLQKKTYTVMTFAEMKQTLEQASQSAAQRRQSDQPEVTFKVSVADTGKTRSISGYDTHEMILKMEMQSTDPQTQHQGTLVITTDMWIAPPVAGYREIRDFYRRMAEKLDWSPEGGMFASRPDVAKGMAEVYKEAAKLDGMPVFETVTMGGPGQGDPAASGSTPPPQQQQQQASRPSLGGALGGALGGKLGIGRKKDTAPPSDQQSTAEAGSAPGSLLEMTTEAASFSSSPVDNALFEIPAGFKKVDVKPGRAQ
jgi:hypothetical protein